MATDKPDLGSVIKALASDLRIDQEHPPAERLEDYLKARLNQEAADSLQEHLSVCAACTQTVLALSESIRPDVSGDSETPEDADKVTDVHVSDAWSRLQHTLKRNPPAGRRRSPPLGLYALAAALLLGCIGFGLWVRSLQQEIATPHGDVVIAQLIPRGSATRGRETSGSDVVVSEDTKTILMFLNIVDPNVLGLEPYHVEVRDTDLRRVWRSEGLERQPDGYIVIEMNAHFLAPGSYHVELTGTRQKREEQVAEYAMRLIYAPSSNR